MFRLNTEMSIRNKDQVEAICLFAPKYSRGIFPKKAKAGIRIYLEPNIQQEILYYSEKSAKADFERMVELLVDTV